MLFQLHKCLDLQSFMLNVHQMLHYYVKKTLMHMFASKQFTFRINTSCKKLPTLEEKETSSV